MENNNYQEIAELIVKAISPTWPELTDDQEGTVTWAKAVRNVNAYWVFMAELEKNGLTFDGMIEAVWFVNYVASTRKGARFWLDNRMTLLFEIEGLVEEFAAVCGTED